MKKSFITSAAILAFACSAFANSNITFEDKILAPASFYNGSDNAGGFNSGVAHFNNNYDTTFGSWGGFSYSNMTDTTTAGFGNQYSAYPGSGAGGSSNYAVAYVDTFTPTIPTITMASGADFTPISLSITNTTYAALQMKNGDPSFGDPAFGGPGVNRPGGDWFLLTISGYDASNNLVGSIPFYLADFRSSNPADNYIVSTWQTIDLTSLGKVSSLQFTLDSSDTGLFGINTPTYFAADNLVVVPEPSSYLLCVIGGCVILFAVKRRKSSQAKA